MSSTAYDQGRAVAADPNASPAAHLGAANELLQAFARGDGVIGLLPPDAPDLLVHLAERAGFGGDARGWLLVALVFGDEDGTFGRTIRPDHTRSAEALREGARLGDPQLIRRYAQVVHHASEADIPEPALSNFRQDAAARLDELMGIDPDPDLRVLAAWMVKDGHGFPADPARARRLLEEAAGGGSGDAEFELYVYDMSGIGGPVDEDAAKGHLGAAANAGNTRAMANLGGMYATGNGVPLDEAQSVSWYRRAADAGHARAAAVLAQMYESGVGAPQDAELAEHYRAVAEELG